MLNEGIYAKINLTNSLEGFIVVYLNSLELGGIMQKREIGVGCADISEQAKKYVNDVLNTERLSYGPYMQKFEQDFATRHGCKFGAMMNSGTSALRVAVAALKEKYNWKDGDEVIVPALTFVATSNVLIQQNLKPVFVDVHPEYYNIDPTKIKDKITERTRGIIPVHLFGMPCDMKEIMDISNKNDFRVIEDSCESMFVKYDNKPVGSFGDVGCFSTYIAHLITTGVGGLAITNDKDIAVIIKSIMNHGRDSIYLSIDDDDDIGGEQLSMVMQRRFKFVRFGYSFRATELEAALGIDQLSRADDIIRKRQENSAYLTSQLSEFSDYIQLPKVAPNREHACMMYPIVVKTPNLFKRDDLTLYLEENGIETRYMLPLLNQPIYIKMFGDIQLQYPHAKYINDNGFYIGSHQKLTKEDLDYVVETFSNFFKKMKK